MVRSVQKSFISTSNSEQKEQTKREKIHINPGKTRKNHQNDFLECTYSRQGINLVQISTACLFPLTALI